MLILQGVDISRLNREIRRGLGIVEKIYNVNYEELVIKSTYEGIHSAGSLHYGNDAFDMRYPLKFPGTIIEGVRRALGPGYHVVEEEDHVHIGYDTKRSYK
ncbi:hypothetical protein ES703_108863 [subsurface metagenome]